jgi:hypothetical protein
MKPFNGYSLRERVPVHCTSTVYRTKKIENTPSLLFDTDSRENLGLSASTLFTSPGTCVITENEWEWPKGKRRYRDFRKL